LSRALLEMGQDPPPLSQHERDLKRFRESSLGPDHRPRADSGSTFLDRAQCALRAAQGLHAGISRGSRSLSRAEGLALGSLSALAEYQGYAAGKTTRRPKSVGSVGSAGSGRERGGTSMGGTQRRREQGKLSTWLTAQRSQGVTRPGSSAVGSITAASIPAVPIITIYGRITLDSTPLGGPPIGLNAVWWWCGGERGQGRAMH